MGKGSYVMVDKMITQDEPSTSYNRLWTSKIAGDLSASTICCHQLLWCCDQWLKSALKCLMFGVGFFFSEENSVQARVQLQTLVPKRLSPRLMSLGHVHVHHSAWKLHLLPLYGNLNKWIQKFDLKEQTHWVLQRGKSIFFLKYCWLEFPIAHLSNWEFF